MSVRRRDVVNLTGGVKTEDGRMLYGMDAEVYMKLKAEEDPDFEQHVASWIEAVLEEPLINKTDLFVSLKNGIALCKLLNKLKPDIVPKYNTKLFRGKLHPLSERENITQYLEGCWRLGLSSSDIFVVADLHGRQGMRAVLNNLAALSQFAINFGCTVPPVGPKKREPKPESEESAALRADSTASPQAPGAGAPSHSRVPSNGGTSRAAAAPSPAPGAPQGQTRHWEVSNASPTVVSVHELPEDTIEEVEDELRKTTLRLEETQRLLTRLEMSMSHLKASKSHVDNLLQLERRKVTEFEKEVNYLRQGGTNAASNNPSFRLIDDLKAERDALKRTVAQLQKEIDEDEEKYRLQTELAELKQRVEQNAADTSNSSQATSSEAFDTLRKKLDEEVLAKEQLELALAEQTSAERATLMKLQTKLTDLENEKKALVLEHDRATDALEHQIRIKESYVQSLLDTAQRTEDELKLRLQSIESEHMSLLNERERLQTQLTARIEATEAAAALETTALKEKLAAFERSQSANSESAEEVKRLLRELSELRTSSSQKVSSLQLEMDNKENDFLRAIRELEDSKSTLRTTLDAQQAKASKQLEKLRNQVSNLESLGRESEQRHREERMELERRMDEMRRELTFKVEQLVKEKQDLVEKHFSDSQAQAKAAWEREHSLARELEAARASHESGDDGLAAEVESLRRETLRLQQEQRNAHDQLVSQQMQRQDELERRILEERRKQESLQQEMQDMRSRLESQLRTAESRHSEETSRLQTALQESAQALSDLSLRAQQRTDELQQELSKTRETYESERSHHREVVIRLEKERSFLVDQHDQLRDESERRIQEMKSKVVHAQAEAQRAAEEAKREKLEAYRKHAELQHNSPDISSRVLEEMISIRTSFQSALTTMTAHNQDLTKQRLALEEEKSMLQRELESSQRRHAVELENERKRAAAEAENRLRAERELLETKPLLGERQNRIRALEKELIYVEVQSKMEIQTLSHELKNSEADKKLKARVAELEAQVKGQREYIDRLERRVERKKVKPTSPRGPVSTSGSTPVPGETRRAHNRSLEFTLPSVEEMQARTMQSRSGVDPLISPRRDRFRRRSVVLTPGDINQEMARLRDVMGRVMLGEVVPMEELLKFKPLFKVDTGRRFFTFMLKEYSEKAAEGEPFYISSSSFDMLKVLLDMVLQEVDLSSGADFISGKILLETSSLIGREIKGEPEPEYLQIVIKPHECWQNTFFWEEYFWAQSTPKFQALFEDQNDDSSNKEKQFFAEEIVEFIKHMYGWGHMPFESLVLFAETLCEKTDVEEAARTQVLEALQHFHQRQLAPRNRTHRKTRIFVGTGPSSKDRRMSVMLDALEMTQLHKAVANDDERKAAVSAAADGITSPRIGADSGFGGRTFAGDSRQSPSGPQNAAPTALSFPSRRPGLQRIDSDPTKQRPQLQRVDSDPRPSPRSPQWMKPRTPGAATPAEPQASGVSAQRSSPNSTPIPAASPQQPLPTPPPRRPAPPVPTRPVSMAPGDWGSSRIEPDDASSERPDALGTLPVLPRARRRTSASATPVEAATTRRRIVAKSMMITEELDAFMGSMLDANRREANF